MLLFRVVKWEGGNMQPLDDWVPRMALMLIKAHDMQETWAPHLEARGFTSQLCHSLAVRL